MITITEFNEVLASAITPITMISGVGLMMICMTARYNHATDRIRQLMAKRSTSEAAWEPDIDAEIDLIFMRASLLRRGLLSVALSAFCSASLVCISVISRFMNLNLMAIEGIILTLGSMLIVFSMLLFSAEINLSSEALKLVVNKPKNLNSTIQASTSL